MNKNTHTLLTVAVFILLFISIGWMAPVMYASHAPDDHFIEVNQFEPANATVDSDSHTVCWDRDIHQEATGEVIMELYLLDENDIEREVHTSIIKSYFEDDDIGSFKMSLPEQELEPGEYEYHAVITMKLANGRVERTFSWKSETFYLKEVGANVDPYTVRNASC